MRNLQNFVVQAVISLMFLSCSVAAAEVDNSNSTQTFVNQAEDAIGALVKTISTPFVDSKDLECLARNIFYESASESTEGKIAVGVVTINRSKNPNFPESICGVVHQRTVLTVPKQVTRMTTVKVGYFGKTEQRKETETVFNRITVCQFSWSCMKVNKPKEDDPRWVESKAIAENLLAGDYDDYKPKYGNLEYFHATYLKPAWHNLKRMVRIGGHVFYASKNQ